MNLLDLIQVVYGLEKIGMVDEMKKTKKIIRKLVIQLGKTVRKKATNVEATPEATDTPKAL